GEERHHTRRRLRREAPVVEHPPALAAADGNLLDPRPAFGVEYQVVPRTAGPDADRRALHRTGQPAYRLRPGPAHPPRRPAHVQQLLGRQAVVAGPLGRGAAERRRPLVLGRGRRGRGYLEPRSPGEVVNGEVAPACDSPWHVPGPFDSLPAL